ncbi:MAG: hypothetical protein Q7S81_00265 [bacterium]|nr:hypothetical protein [bacterium]
MEEKKTTEEDKNKKGAVEIADDENREPKISFTEIFFITPFYLMSDTIDYALFFVGLDDFGIMDTVRTSISQVYFVMIKKMGTEIWMTNLVINGIKLLPYVGSLLPSTLVWLIVIFIDRGAMNKIKKIDKLTGGKLVKGLEKVGKIK